MGSYDLTPLRELRAVKSARISFWTVSIATLGIAAFAGYQILSVTLDRDWTPARTAGFGLIFWILGMAIFMVLILGPQPSRLDIDDDGARFVNRRGRVIRSAKWRDPSLHLRLSYTSDLRRSGFGGQAMYQLFGVVPAHIYLVPDAFAELTRRAKENGLAIDERPMTGANLGWTQVTITRAGKVAKDP
jgi:hypothetical protein